MNPNVSGQTESEQKAPVGNRQRRENPLPGCPLTAALAAVGGKWKLIIVYWLQDEPRHFAELRRLMPEISQKVLTEQLRELVADGLVAREPTGRVPAPVVYRLTEHGRTLLPLVDQVVTWGRAHQNRLSPEETGAAL